MPMIFLRQRANDRRRRKAITGQTERQQKVYLVLIRGSNLDRPPNEGAINLTHAGLQRHRVLFIREMSDEEIRQVGETGPTIDSITVAEFESNAALKEWVNKKAPAFARENK